MAKPKADLTFDGRDRSRLHVKVYREVGFWPTSIVLSLVMWVCLTRLTGSPDLSAGLVVAFWIGLGIWLGWRPLAERAGWLTKDDSLDLAIDTHLLQGLKTETESHTKELMEQKPRPLVIAVDGPAASGKGTIASRLAAHYGLPFLDTGLLYRAVGVDMMSGGRDLSDARAAEEAARALTPDRLSDASALTTGDAGEAASRVAGIPGVRAALLELQQAFARQPGGAVLDGRDIGTVIAPDAVAKLFVTASPEVRARRRWMQLNERGDLITYEAMLADILRRDERDAGRGAAPMVQAPDAVLLDTTEMDIEAAFDAARRIVEAARTR